MEECKMVKVAKSVIDLIGETPIVQLSKVVPEDAADVYVKLEAFNIGGSVKDRIALSMIETAEKEGKLKPDGTIIEPTSGNTGVGLALVAAAKGYKAIFVMPETMSIERRKLFKAYGAELILTPGEKGIKASIEKAKQLAEENGYFLPLQFENEANPRIHEETTGPEIEEVFKGEKIDAFVSGVGTGGTITGVARVLKKSHPETKIYALEPAESPILSGGEHSPHKIQGIGTGFIPGVLDTTLFDEVIQIKSDDAFAFGRRLAKEEGLLVGISSAAAILGAIKVAEKLGKGKKVVTVAPDNGERYLSTPLFPYED